jgi:hypothetical protein
VNKRQFRKALTDELERLGVSYDLEQSGKAHPRLVFEVAGRRRTYYFPGSPSDNRALKNALADLRRICGAVGGSKSPWAPKHHHERKGTDQDGQE